MEKISEGKNLLCGISFYSYSMQAVCILIWFHPPAPLCLYFQLSSRSCSFTCRDCNWCHKQAQPRNLHSGIYSQQQQHQRLTHTPSETNHINPNNYSWQWVQLWAKLISLGCPQWHCRRAGEAGGDSKWEVILHPSWHDKDKILSPEECLHKLKGKQKILS